MQTLPRHWHEQFFIYLLFFFLSGYELDGMYAYLYFTVDPLDAYFNNQEKTDQI